MRKKILLAVNLSNFFFSLGNSLGNGMCINMGYMVGFNSCELNVL